MFKKVALAALAVAVVSTHAHALTTTQGFTVTATVTPICTINTLPNYAFGAIGGTATTFANLSASTVSVTCSTGAPYAITLSSPNTVANVFSMVNGATKMAYSLYFNNNTNPQWDATAGGTFSSIGNGGAQTISMYGTIPSQTPPVGGWLTTGTYTDNVTMTITY